jgi:hypothetical protein
MSQTLPITMSSINNAIFTFAISPPAQQGTKRPSDENSLDDRPLKRLRVQGGISIDHTVSLQVIPQNETQAPQRSSRASTVATRRESIAPAQKKTRVIKPKVVKTRTSKPRSCRIIKTKIADSGDEEYAGQEKTATASTATPVPAATPSTGLRRSGRVVPTRKKPVYKPLNFDTTPDGFMPSAGNGFTFKYDSPSGTTPAELNKLFNPPKLPPKGYDEKLGEAAFGQLTSYKKLGQLPAPGLADRLVREMEELYAKEARELEDDVPECWEVEDSMA